MNILNILLPNKFPMAISTEPSLIAANETAISGSDVETAKNKVPTNDFLNQLNQLYG